MDRLLTERMGNVTVQVHGPRRTAIEDVAGGYRPGR